MRKRTRTEKFLYRFLPVPGFLFTVLLLTAVLLAVMPQDAGIQTEPAPGKGMTAAAPSAEPARSEQLSEEALPQEELSPDAADGGTSFPVFLMQGDRGEAVYRLQRQLETLGYDIGTRSGVYDLATAAAVRRFQEDTGFLCDGICTAAVTHAIAYLADGAVGDVTDAALCDALRRAGYLTAEDAAAETEAVPPQTVRNALILFQRTHGLCGSGEADYATLCALGMETGCVFPLPRAAEPEAPLSGSDALFDLRCRMTAQALAEFLCVYPDAYDLHTLTCCAAVLCARTEDVRFPASFDAVCSAGLLPETAQTAAAGSFARADDLLLLRAAEDALLAWEAGADTGAFRALYAAAVTEPLPEGAEVCARSTDFIFYR